MNVVKELHRIAKSNYDSQLKEAESLLDSVKANLEMESAKDVEMLQFFGTREIIPVNKSRVDEITNAMASEIVSREDVMRICIKYNLRFLLSSLYKKEVPLHALNDLRKYKNDRQLSNCDLSRLMVIAPASHFELGPKPQKDPVLLYPEGSGYKVISTWGNDFSWTRRISGFLHDNPNGIILFGILILLNFIITTFVLKGGDSIWYVLNLPALVGILWIIEKIDATPTSDKWDEAHK